MDNNLIIRFLAFSVSGLFFTLALIWILFRAEKRKSANILKEFLMFQETTLEMDKGQDISISEKTKIHEKELKTICDFYSSELQKRDEVIKNLHRNNQNKKFLNTSPTVH